MDFIIGRPSVLVKVSLWSFKVNLLDCSRRLFSTVWTHPSTLFGSLVTPELCALWLQPPTPHRSRPVACSYPPFQITFLAFPPFLFLISSSFCCICPFVTSWRYRLLHQQGESFVCACVCVWSRSLKRWSFDVGLHSCVHTVLAKKKNPAAS